MCDPKLRRRARRVQIGDKGACGSIRPPMEPWNHAVSYRWCEPGFRLCIRFGHLGCSCPHSARGDFLVARSCGHEKRGAACAVPLGLPWLRGLPWPRSLVVLCPAGLGPGSALLVVRGPDPMVSFSELVGVVYAQRASRRFTPV